MHKCEDTGKRVENEDSDHGCVEDPLAPEGVRPDQTQNQEGNRDLAGCKAEDTPGLGDPVVLDDQSLLFGL